MELNCTKNNSEVYNDKKIYDHFNERLKTQNYVLPEKIKLNEIQFTSQQHGDVIFNSKFIFDIQQQLSHIKNEINKIQEQYKTSLTNQRKDLLDEVIEFIQNHTYETLKVENLKFKSPIPGQTGMILNESEIYKIINGLEKVKTETIKNVIQLLYNKGLFDTNGQIKIKFLNNI